MQNPAGHKAVRSLTQGPYVTDLGTRVLIVSCRGCGCILLLGISGVCCGLGEGLGLGLASGLGCCWGGEGEGQVCLGAGCLGAGRGLLGRGQGGGDGGGEHRGRPSLRPQVQDEAGRGWGSGRPV